MEQNDQVLVATFQERLKGTFSADKHEILFSEFGVNYNDELEQFKKGTTLFRKKVEFPVRDASGNDTGKTKLRMQVCETNGDIIGDDFWMENEHLLKPFRDS